MATAAPARVLTLNWATEPAADLLVLATAIVADAAEDEAPEADMDDMEAIEDMDDMDMADADTEAEEEAPAEGSAEPACWDVLVVDDAATAESAEEVEEAAEDAAGLFVLVGSEEAWAVVEEAESGEEVGEGEETGYLDLRDNVPATADEAELAAELSAVDAVLMLVEPVADASVAVTVPEVTVRSPHRAFCSCTACCWSAAEQLLYLSVTIGIMP